VPQVRGPHGQVFFVLGVEVPRFWEPGFEDGQASTKCRSPVESSLNCRSLQRPLATLDFNADRMQIRITNILEGMRRERLRPHCVSNRGCESNRATVHHHISLAIAAQEIAPAQDVKQSRPAMRMEWNGLARRDGCVEHTNPVVFKQDNMMLWRSDQSIKLLSVFLLVWLGLHSVSMPPVASVGRRSAARYLIPTTIESGPTRCSTRVSLKPASFIQPMQSAPV